MLHPETQRFWQVDPLGSLGGGPPPAAGLGPDARLLPGNRYGVMTPEEIGNRAVGGDPAALQQAVSMAPTAGPMQPTYAPQQPGQQLAAVVEGQAGPNRVKLHVGAPGADLTTPGQPGAGGGPQPFTGQKYMTSGGRPAKYSKADILREAALAQQRKGQMAGFSSGRDKLNRDMVSMSYAWMAEASAEQAAAGIEASNARTQYQDAAKSLDRGRRQLDSLKIDPDRYWKNMPSSQKTLMRIGLFFGGLAEGLSGGRLKSAAMTMLMKGFDRDMDSQRSNMKKVLASVQMDERQRNHFLARFDKQEARRRVSGLRVMQLQLSRMGLMEKRLGHKEKYAELVNGIDQHMLDVMRQSRGGGGRKTPTLEYQMHLKKDQMTHGAMLKGAGASKKKGQRGEDAMAEALAILPEMEKQFHTMPLSVHAGKWDPTGRGQDYERIRTRMSVALWRMFDSGKLSDFDMTVAMKSFFPAAKWGAVPGPLKSTYRAAYGKAFTSLRSFLDRAKKRMDSGEGYTVSPERKKQIKAAWRAKGLGT